MFAVSLTGPQLSIPDPFGPRQLEQAPLEAKDPREQGLHFVDPIWLTDPGKQATIVRDQYRQDYKCVGLDLPEQCDAPAFEAKWLKVQAEHELAASPEEEPGPQRSQVIPVALKVPGIQAPQDPSDLDTLYPGWL